MMHGSGAGEVVVAPPSRPPEQDELEALIEEARERARRRRRRCGVVLALAAAALGALFFALAGRGAYGPITWLNARDIVLAPEQIPGPGSGPSVAQRSGQRSCSTLPAADACLVVIHLTGAGHSPGVRLVILPNVYRQIAALA
ncbi:MAG: hypothetical protein JOY89_18715, partial [Solirubrobacterales bacterium]|nr:hypothetical protein [Solirubrobacterales bacterium]